MHVVITGGAGFIGSNLVAELTGRGVAVTVFDPCRPPAHEPGVRPDLPGARLVSSDPREAADEWRATAGSADAVVHLAALTGTGQSMYEIADYTDVNAGLSAWIAEQLVSGALEPGRVVLASTRAVYGDGVGECAWCGRTPLAPRTRGRLAAGRWEPCCAVCGAEAKPVPIREDDPRDPLTPYAMTKALAEDVLGFAGRTSGVPVVPLRLFNVYGAGQSPRNPYVGVVSAFARMALDGEPITAYEDGRIARDFVHVDDVVRALFDAIHHPRPPTDPVNIGSGVATDLRALATTLRRVTGSRSRTVLTGTGRLGDPRSVTADIGRAAGALGWSPRVPLETGLESLVAWLRGSRHEGAGAMLAAAEDELASRGLLVGATPPGGTT